MLESVQVKACMAAGATQQQCGAWLWQVGERGEGRARMRQPQFVHGIQAAKQGNDIGTCQAIVFWSNQQIPMARVEAWVEYLDDPAAPRTQKPRGQCCLSTTADRQCRWMLQGLGERIAESGFGARQPSRCKPSPRCLGFQYPLACRPDRQRGCQRIGLPAVAGMAVSQRPELARIHLDKGLCSKN